MLFQLMLIEQVRRFHYFEGFAVIMTNWTLKIFGITHMAWKVAYRIAIFIDCL